VTTHLAWAFAAIGAVAVALIVAAVICAGREHRRRP
jgi:hypothetical protein